MRLGRFLDKQGSNVQFMPDYCDLFADSGAEEATGSAGTWENHKTPTDRGAARHDNKPIPGVFNGCNDGHRSDKWQVQAKYGDTQLCVI